MMKIEHCFCTRRFDAFDPVKECKPLRQLNTEEQAEVAENRALVYTHMPEFAEMVKLAHEAHLIDGWRSVRNVKIFEKD